MLSLWLGCQPPLTEIATAVGRIKLRDAALAEKLQISRFARVATAAAITVSLMGTDDLERKNHVAMSVQHITLRPDGGVPMTLRRRENRFSAPGAPAGFHPSG